MGRYAARAVVVVVSFLLPAFAFGQHFPAKPVRVILGSSPGGALDILTRLIGPPMAEQLGQPIVVENRSQGVIYGLDLISRSPADGHTISVTASSGYINGVLTTKLPFDLKNDIEPIIQLTSQPYVLVVHPSLSVMSVAELIAFAKSKPRSLNYGSPGTGTAGHVGIELLSSQTNMAMVHIPYKGAGPAFADLVGGRLQVFLGSPISLAQFIKTNKVRALAVTTRKRSKLLPDIPTVTESGTPGFELESWYGMVAPRGIGSAQAQILFESVSKVLARGDIQKRITNDGAEIPVASSRADFKRVVLTEIEKWQQFGSKTGFKVEN
jgi:tripartite-type tricarboxylate transporter receptor subunit TctC